MTRFACIAFFSLFVGSCGVVARGVEPRGGHASLRGNPEIYRVGDLEVRLYQDQDKLAQDLPVLLTLINATKIGDRQLRILGYYDKQKSRIYAIDDARVLLHEFKHFLEPDWRHGVGMSARLEGLEAQAEPDPASRGVSRYAPTLDLVDLARELEALEETVDDAKSYTDQ